MFKLTILLIVCVNCYHCYKQQPMTGSSEYGGGAKNSGQQQTISLPKPQAIIHLPKNIYTHKLTDTIKLDHDQLSNYISSINYIPHTIHKHAEMLAQLDPADIQKYGQSVHSNQLPLISLPVPESKSSEYNDAQMKMEEYPAAPQQEYAPQQSQSSSGYQQGGTEYSQDSSQQSQRGYGAPAVQQQQNYGSSQDSTKDCDEDKSSDNYGNQENNSQEQYGSGGYEQGSGENTGGYEDNNKMPEVEYQTGPQMSDNYDSGNNDQSNGYQENNDGGSYDITDSHEGGGYENNGDQGHSQQNNGGYSNNQQQDYGKSNSGNEYNSGNYESSPFDYNFVQEILKHVMNQLEQLQIDPDSLSVYGKDSNQGGDYNSGGNENEYNSPSGYEIQGGHSIQLVDRPQGSQEVNCGYSVNHESSYAPQPAHEGSNNYEPNYSSSSTRSQATSVQTYGRNGNKDHSTITYRMPTINLELPKNQIEHIMKAVSGKKGSYCQPIMVKANSFKLPQNLKLGKIKSIAFVKSSKLGSLKDLPSFNTQLLGSNINSLNNYKIVSTPSKIDSNPVLSAYGYGVYGSASNKKPTIVLPLKNRSKKRLRHSPYTSLQAASSNIKSIVSALPKMNKVKKASSVVTPAVIEKKNQ